MEVRTNRLNDPFISTNPDDKLKSNLESPISWDPQVAR